MGNHNQPFLSVGIDVGADFSMMAVALPTQEIAGRPYKSLHSSLNSIQGAVDRIRAMEAQHGLNAKVFMESTGIYHYPLYYRLCWITKKLRTADNCRVSFKGRMVLS